MLTRPLAPSSERRYTRLKILPPIPLTGGHVGRYTPQRCRRRDAARRSGWTRKLGRRVDNAAVGRYASSALVTGRGSCLSGRILHNGEETGRGPRAGNGIVNASRVRAPPARAVSSSLRWSFDKVQRGRCGVAPLGGWRARIVRRMRAGACGCRVRSRREIIAGRSRSPRRSHLSASLILAQEQRWRRA